MSPALHKDKVRFVCISDTHNHAPREGFTLPKGDILVHAGDLTNQGSYDELKKAANWLEKADCAVKLVIAGESYTRTRHAPTSPIAHRVLPLGNHDLSLDLEYRLKHEEGWSVTPEKVEECRRLMNSIPGVTYLQHSSVDVQLPRRSIDGQDGSISLRVFGSPFSPDRSAQNWAFQYPEGEAEALWNAIPAATDVLITHTPPAGHCDVSKHWVEGGCAALKHALWTVRPALHICGHCHEGRGAEIVRWGDSPRAVESKRTWDDPGAGNKKQSLLDLTDSHGDHVLEVGKETAVVNASIMAKSWGRGAKAFNKPIVVDVPLSIFGKGHERD